MTLERIITLSEAIQDALEATHYGRTVEVRRWILIHRRDVCDANQETISAKGLDGLIREHRKRGGKEEGFDAAQICLAFGIGLLELDSEISIPTTDDVLYGPCEWIDIYDVTDADVDAHLVLIRAQKAALTTKEASYELLKQKMVQRQQYPGQKLRDIIGLN